MKKKIIALMLSAMIVMTAVGCGSDKNEGTAEGTEVAETTETTEKVTSEPSASSAFDLKGSDYAKVCDYSAFDVTITGDYDVDDADVKEYFEGMFNNYGPFYTEDPDKTTIGEGDVVDVDYVGKLDGVAFDGGSAEHQIIDVDKNASVTGTGYIDGFTDGLKGASVGDVVDCDVTFPENYGNTDLAGKAVVFTFTVNSIQKELTIDDVDDDFAKEQFQVDTVEAMYDQIRSYMEQYAEYSKQSDTYQAVQNYLIDNSTVEVPEDYLAARVSDYKRQFIATNCDGDESALESFLSDNYGKTVEEMEEYWKEGMTKSISLELIMDAIVEELGITLDEDAFTSYVQQMVTNNGYESADAMYNMYGYGDTAYGEKYFRNLYTYDQALEKVMENATVNVDPGVAADGADDTEAQEADGTEALQETETE